MLKAVILSESPVWKRWEAECVRKLLETGRVEIRKVWVGSDEPGARSPHSPLYRLLRQSWQRRSGCLAPVHFASVVPETTAVHFGKWDNRSPTPEETDFVLRFGAGNKSCIWNGNARYGVWEFRCQGQETVFDLLFWNRLGARPTGTVGLCRTGGIGTGFDASPLREGTFATGLRSVSRHLNEIYRSMAEWPAAVCTQLADGDPPEALTRVPTEASEAIRPQRASVWEMMLFICLMAMDKGRRWFARWFVKEHWNVGVAAVPIERFLLDDRLPDIRWLPKRERFLADPFGLRIDGRLHMLAEESDHLADSKGFISAIGPDHGDRLPPIPVMRLPFHMSYPYLIRHEGEIYCIPETCQAGEVALYRSMRFPDRWEKQRVLIRDFPAIDATVVLHEGLWWLFCTEERTGPNSHLHVWYAESLDGEWRPHPLNPVKIDVRSARPAGTPFRWKGRLYRPAQDCSRTYGGAVTLNRIAVLNPREFREEPVKRLEPDGNWPFPDGMHTLSSAEGLTLIDGKSESVDWRVFTRRWQARRTYKQNTSLMPAIPEPE